MATHKTKYITIDGERLRQAINTRGMSLIEAGKKMGRSAAYFSHICLKGSIPEYVEPAIENVLGISLGEYLPNKPEVVEGIDDEYDDEEVKVLNIKIDYEELQEAIYHALMGAIRKLQTEGAWL